MQITYCRRWNTILNKPIQPLTEAQAQRRDQARQWYTVVLGDPASPDCYLEVAWENEHVGVWFLDEHHRRWLKYSFRRLDDARMFLHTITLWKYPKGAGKDLDGAAAIEEIAYEPDGAVVRSVTTVRKNKVVEERYTDVPLDINWEPVPKFGGYRSIARLDREVEPVFQDS